MDPGGLKKDFMCRSDFHCFADSCTFVKKSCLHNGGSLWRILLEYKDQQRFSIGM